MPQPSHIHPSADPNELVRRTIEREVHERVNAEFRASVGKWFMRYGYFKDQKGVVTTYPKTKLFDVQRKIFEHHDACLAAKKPCKQIILKPRRGGASTGVQAAMYFRGRMFPGREAAIMGDIAGTSSTVFEIYRRLAENDKLDWGDGLGNLREDDKENNLADDIKLPNGSTYKKVTAGSTNANRSGGVQFANCTEVAYYPINLDRDPLTSFLGSWYGEGEVSYAAMDSTSNGPAGKFYDYYSDERNDWHKIFSAWHEEPTCRLEFNTADEEAKLHRTVNSDRELKEMQLRFSLDWTQMNWINFRLYDKCGGNKEQLNKEFPNTVEEAFLKTSALRFNIRVLESMENMAKNHPPQRGDFVTQADQTASFLPSPNGEVAIYEEPRVGCKYIGAFDPCAGEDQQQKGQQANPDAHSVRILRDGYIDPQKNESFPPKTVAHYHSRADVTIAVEQAAAMSRHFGKCLFVVETNGVGLYPVKALRALGIPLWQRQQKAQTQGQTEAADGWFSNAQLRTTIIDNLGSYIEKWRLDAPTFEEFDLATIAELKKVVTLNGKDQAMSGFHDDTMISLALGLYLRQNATALLEVKRRAPDIRKILKRQGWKLQGATAIQG